MIIIHYYFILEHTLPTFNAYVGMDANCIDDTGKWIFPAPEDNESLRLVDNHKLLELEYSILRAQLNTAILKREDISAQLDRALKMSDLLRGLYVDYLAMPAEAARLRNEQHIYRTYLPLTPSFFALKKIPSITQDIRATVASANTIRNIIGRVRRLIILITNHFDSYFSWVPALDKFILPVFMQSSWVLLLPRLLTNLAVIIKHVLLIEAGVQEAKLDGLYRFSIQVQRRWFELANDIPWIILGLLNCFFFSAALAPVGIYLTAFLLFYDVVLVCIRAYIDYNRLQEIKENDNEDSKYLEEVELRMSYERKKFIVQCSNTTAVLLAYAFVLPIFALSPPFLILGASIVILTTIINYFALHWLEGQKPLDGIEPKISL